MYSHKLVLPVFDCQYFVVSVFLIWTLINQHGTMSTPADQIEVYRWKMSSIWIFTVVENDYRSQRNCRSSLMLYFWVLSVCLSVKWSCSISFWFQISVKPSVILVLPNVILSVISAVIFCAHLLHQTPQRQILNPRKDTQMQLERKIKSHKINQFKVKVKHQQSVSVLAQENVNRIEVILAVCLFEFVSFQYLQYLLFSSSH